jgi:hypothetical protein
LKTGGVPLKSALLPGIDATFIHAFDDLNVMAGNGTIALEIVEDLPEFDAVVIPWGGGGLTCGIASALRALNVKGTTHSNAALTPRCKIYAAEVATAAPLTAVARSRLTAVCRLPAIIRRRHRRSPRLPQMLDRAKELIDGSLVADLDSVASALRLLAGAQPHHRRRRRRLPRRLCLIGPGRSRQNRVHHLRREYRSGNSLRKYLPRSLEAI